jgi:hypothetical protein
MSDGFIHLTIGHGRERERREGGGKGGRVGCPGIGRMKKTKMRHGEERGSRCEYEHGAHTENRLVME